MITTHHVEAFRRDGYVILDRLIDDQTGDRIKAAMARVYEGNYTADRRPPAIRKAVAPFGSAKSVQWVLNARVLDHELWQLSISRELGECAARLLVSPCVSIVEDQLLAKPPNDGLPVNVHQDYSYWPFSRSNHLISCWIALCDVTSDMGPLLCIKGSHKWGPAKRPSELILGREDNWLEGISEVKPDEQALAWGSAELKAGGCVFFHALTFHGSRANQSNRWRTAMSLHWASEECKADLAETRHHNYPYFFARLKDGGRLVNKYMPQVYPIYAEH